LDEIARLPGVTVKDLVARELVAPRMTDLGARILVHVGAVRVVPAADPRDGEKSPRRSELAQAAQAVLDAAAERGFAADLVYVLLLVEPSLYAKVLKIRQEVSSQALAGQGASITGAWRSGRAATLPLRAVAGQLVIHLAPAESGPVFEQVHNRLADYACVVVWMADGEALDIVTPVVGLVERGPTQQWGLVITARAEVVGHVGPLLEGRFRWQLHGADPADFEEILRLAATAAPPG